MTKLCFISFKWQKFILCIVSRCITFDKIFSHSDWQSLHREEKIFLYDRKTLSSSISVWSIYRMNNHCDVLTISQKKSTPDRWRLFTFKIRVLVFNRHKFVRNQFSINIWLFDFVVYFGFVSYFRGLWSFVWSERFDFWFGQQARTLYTFSFVWLILWASITLEIIIRYFLNFVYFNDAFVIDATLKPQAKKSCVCRQNAQFL